ncbi:MAG: PAS domain S-box protein [Spirochaetaceae bacterium]|nr:MAG: PAS domain S-box protein [Spirochaetaceae bacterium]
MNNGDQLQKRSGTGNQRVTPVAAQILLVAVCFLVFSAAVLPAEVGENWQGAELFEEHGTIKLIIDPANGAIVGANRAAREFYGYPSLLDMVIGEINLLTDAEVAHEMRLAASEERNYFLFRHATRDRGVRDVEVYSFPVVIGGTTYLYSIIFDITDRLVAQQQVRTYEIRTLAGFAAALLAGLLVLLWWIVRTRNRLRITSTSLAETEAVYRSYVNGAPLGIFVVDQTARCREVNPEACRITGYSPDELIGMTVAEIVLPAHRRVAAGHFRTLLAEGRASSELAFVTRAGETRWCNLVSTAVSPSQFLGFAEDITQRKTEEQARLQLVTAATDLQTCTSETVDYAGIAETAKDLSGASCAALNLFDPDGMGFTTSAVAGLPHSIRQAGELFGFPLEGRHWNYDPSREAALGDNRTTVFPSLGALTSSSFSASLADGVARVFDLGEVVITRITNAAGTLGDFTLLFSRGQHLKRRDLLEVFAGMVGATLARMQTEKQNARLVGEKETLLKEVQHRIKNNMGTMSSLLSLQAHEVRGTRVAEEVLNDVRSRFRSMEVLYDRLYRADAPGSGSLAEYLKTLVRQVVSIFPGAERVRVTVSSDGDSCGLVDTDTSDTSGQCVLDVKRLSTVGLIVNELLTNAMKYAFPPEAQPVDASIDPPSLVVTTACRDEAIEIRVQDNGPGLPDSFDPDAPAGFGMTMVQAMVAQLNGTIRYESSHDPDSHGTRVVVSFPREISQERARR